MDRPLSICGIICSDCRLYDYVSVQILFGRCLQPRFDRWDQHFRCPDVEVVFFGQQRWLEVNEAAQFSRAFFISSVVLMHFKKGEGQ